MPETVPPSQAVLGEALTLSTEILRNIELSEVSLTNIALKCSRLARLLNDFDYQKIMAYEAGGYPTAADGVPPEVWKLAVVAGRNFQWTDPITKKPSERIYIESIAELEVEIQMSEPSLAAARDPAIGSQERPNPWGLSVLPQGNVIERNSIRKLAVGASHKLASRRTLIYQYAVLKHYELKFSGIADDVFTRIRERVDANIGLVVPEAVKRFSAVYENLRSENSEDWSNAVHSCRRILQDLADAVFPAQDGTRVRSVDGHERTIHLGKEHYINRILAFIEDSSDSKRFSDIVGSQLAFLGERLDSILRAAQKGSHDTIVTREEADRYVVYSYLIVGDILALRETSTQGTPSNIGGGAPPLPGSELERRR